jgi:peptidoglycan L-alanyl-D-glutamate endopeptidase CwlK
MTNDHPMTYDPRSYLAQMALKSLGFNPGLLDGLWGAKSMLAYDAWRAHEDYIKADGADTVQKIDPVAGPNFGVVQKFDTRSELNIAGLKPVAQAAARKFMAAVVPAMAGHGYEVRITSGYRSYAEQDALYAQGRTTKGPIVTQAPAGYSWHNFGLSFDITLFKGGVPVYDSPLYAECAAIGETQGLDCGAYWAKFKDEPHYQVATGKTMAQLRAAA